jgi:hypothetical protein
VPSPHTVHNKQKGILAENACGQPHQESIFINPFLADG